MVLGKFEGWLLFCWGRMRGCESEGKRDGFGGFCHFGIFGDPENLFFAQKIIHFEILNVFWR